jgi:hypothetical protein
VQSLYWTATSNEHGSGAWAVSLDSGYVIFGSTVKNEVFVWPVRGSIERSAQ